jgi:16S rRNA (guanine1207-N2)-methyltransferase
MATEHYFTNDAQGEYEPRTITATLAGRTVELTTAGGMFSPEHVDRGTGILINSVALPPKTGNLLDVGCGWGPIAISMALHSPDATVWAIDVNDRALEITRLNAQALGLTNIRAVRPDEVPADVTFAEMWSNPPIRVGKVALHEILRTWLPRLEDGCEAQLVVAKQLGADSLMKWMNTELAEFGSTERSSTEAGFRVLTFTRIREE